MLPDKIRLDIVTPDRLVLLEWVDEVQIPGQEGYLGVLPGHAPLITELKIGQDFLQRVPPQLARLKRQGVNYRALDLRRLK